MADQISSLKTDIKFKDTPIGKIPVDWELLSLEDVCDEVYRYPTYYNIEYVDPHQGVPEIRGELIKGNGELSNNMTEYRYISKETSAKFPRTILHEGDFVLSVRGTMGKIGYISDSLENANMTANLMRISPNHNKVYPLWMKQFLLSNLFQKRLNDASSATTIKTIKAPELKALEISLPSLPEQKKIAEILTNVDKAIEKTAQIIENTREAKKGLMQRLLTRGIGHQKFKKTELGEIPEEWEVVRLGDICNVVGGSTPSTSRKDYWGGDIPFVTPTDITKLRGREILDTTQRITSEGLASCGTRLLPAGTILLTSRATIGACAINKKPMATNQGFANLLCNERAYNWFIFYKMIAIQNELQKLGSGSTFKEVSKNSIKSIILSLPPIPEQEQIVNILHSLDEDIEKEASHKEQLESLKKGLMQVLLTGKVRVNV